MTTVLYWLLAILVFCLLILVHECGHYAAARLAGVRIYEFSIGMGPKMITYTSKKTGIRYSVGVFLIGGYVSMAGEDEESDDPNAFGKKAAWKRMIIVAAGGLMNLVLGFVLMLVLVLTSGPLASNQIHSYPGSDYFEQNQMVSSEESGLRPGDRIIAINGTRVHIAADMRYEIMHQGGSGPVDVTVVRDGKELTLSVLFPTIGAEGTDMRFGFTDFYVAAEPTTVGSVMRHTYYQSVSTVKMIWDSLVDLVQGRYGLEAVSGPVGVAGAMTEAAATDWNQFLYLVAVISVNLGVLNLLPIPALDGGRFVFLLLETIFRRPVVPPKYEALVHTIGFFLFILLAIIVLFKDVIWMFG